MSEEMRNAKRAWACMEEGERRELLEWIAYDSNPREEAGHEVAGMLRTALEGEN